jgi:hypothetical protein
MDMARAYIPLRVWFEWRHFIELLNRGLNEFSEDNIVVLGISAAVMISAFQNFSTSWTGLPGFTGIMALKRCSFLTPYAAQSNPGCGTDFKGYDMATNGMRATGGWTFVGPDG